MIKVLHLIPRFTIGGAEWLVLEYAKCLPAYGFEMKAANVRGNGSFWQAIRRLRSLVQEWRPDIIHTHIFSSDVAGYLLKRRFPKIKWVSTQHNVARQHSWGRRLVLRCILRQADQVIAVSPRVAGEIIIPNAIALDEWLAVSAAGLLSGKTLRLATIGRLEEQKGIDLLLRALSRVRDIDWRLSVFGTGNLETKLKNQARQLGIEDRITWHGAVADLPRRLPEIDIVIQPSRWEGMSLAVMEAMAAGRIVIASEAAGEGLVEQMKTGIIINAECRMQFIPTGASGNAELLKVLHWMNEHREEARAMAAKAREYARRHFGLAPHLSKLIEQYQQLCGEQARADS